MISIIISVYKDIEALEIILKSLEKQSEKNFEVIIAEDCSTEEMKDFLVKNKFNLKTIKHVFQEDIGFRKTKILNEAIKISEGEYLVFIDGDCILHKDFIKEYKNKSDKNIILCGRRVMLSEKLSKKIRKSKEIPNLMDIIFSKTRHKEEGIKLPSFLISKKTNGILGCNFGISKELIEKINGFDEDYKRAGTGEDDDIKMRLEKLGDASFENIRNGAIQYHLEHSRPGRTEDSDVNKVLFLEKTKEKNYRCKNGLHKL